jgi:hypothetical protein
MPAINKPTYPTPMTESDMLFNTLVDVFIADDVYFGFGTYSESEIASIYNTQSSIKDELSNSFDMLGELAEKPGKADSKITKLKTRNYTIPGKRTSTVELTIAGLIQPSEELPRKLCLHGKERDHSSGIQELRPGSDLQWTALDSGLVRRS